MATPGVDGCWTGPGDMALSMGIDPRKAGESDEHARALEKIVQACKNTGKIPGIAAGGIDSAAEAYRRIRAGAALVQLYTALVYRGPGLIGDINRGLLDLLDRDGLPTLTAAIGADLPC